MFNLSNFLGSLQNKFEMASFIYLVVYIEITGLDL